MFIKCGAGNVALFATPGSAPQGVLRGGVGSVNRRLPLKPVGPSSHELNCLIVFFGPHIRFIFLKNFCYAVFSYWVFRISILSCWVQGHLLKTQNYSRLLSGQNYKSGIFWKIIPCGLFWAGKVENLWEFSCLIVFLYYCFTASRLVYASVKYNHDEVILWWK